MTDTHTTAHIPDEAIHAALLSMAQDNIGADVQGLLVHGFDKLNAKPNALRNALAAAFPYLSAPCAVEVKKLEWVSKGQRHPPAENLYAAETSFGLYMIAERQDGSHCGAYTVPNTGLNHNATNLDDAKAAAQADFERRIFSNVVTNHVDVAAVREALRFLLDVQPRIEGNEPFNGDQSKWNDYCDAIHEAERALSAEPAQPKGHYQALICKGIPSDCCDYGVVSHAAGKEVCRVWDEDYARLIADLLNAEPAHLSPDFAKTIAYVIKEESLGGAACGWKSCSGCLETSEGQHCGDYPYSDLFKTHVGFGCSDCGGLGVVWEYYSKACLDEMQQELKIAEPAQGEQCNHITDASKMVDALKETRIDLVILQGNVADAAKTNSSWEGMSDRVLSWIDRIDASLPAAPATEAQS